MAEIRKKKIIRKTGRTIIVRTENDFTPTNLVGLVNYNKVDNEKYFLLFDTLTNSNSAYKILKNDLNLSVRYAYYRIFFKMSGIEETTDYTQIKNVHTNWIYTNSGGTVLYYKQYKKDGKFIGCGDFSVDTKESMDKLLNKDELKTFSFDTFTGTYYRYNKKSSNEIS